jgi:hypothetical protein
MTHGVLKESGYEKLPVLDMEAITKRQNLGQKPRPCSVVLNTKRNNFVPIVYRIPKPPEGSDKTGHIDDDLFEKAKKYLPNTRRR